MLVSGLAVLTYWGKPVLYLPPDALWPMGSSLCAPHVWRYTGTGAVTILPWLGLCNGLGSLVARTAFPPVRAGPLPAIKAAKQS